ncbi:hypothetical protein IOCL2690_000121300, partial [Leishmania lindenbergi]
MPLLNSELMDERNSINVADPDFTARGERQIPSSLNINLEMPPSIANLDSDTLKTGSVPDSYSLPLSWRKLSYSAGKKRILCGLTGTALPGRCLAILGSSGAGKTTFLNAISDRLASGGALRL